MQMLGGRYRFLHLLGRGGQGEVWHAFDEKLQVDVALKVLRTDLIRDEHAHERLRSEVRTARQVVSPNVCRVFDLVIEDGHELISMELVDGTTLADLVAGHGPLDLGRAGEITAQLLAGLEAIHAAGFVHGDVKPENVMLTPSKRVVVMDFGVARNVGDVRARTIAGTPGYMPPEQAAGLTVDARADVFSSAVLLAEMISREPIATQADRQQLWARLREEPPRVPPGPWAPVLRRALCRSPEGRYSTAGAMARVLELEQREIGRAEQSPYPGLLPFTREDAHLFFGREFEVEALLRKLRRPRLRAVIGASGAGKSSLVQAGLLPALSADWAALVCTPADRPFALLAQALATKRVRDSEAARPLPPFEDLGACLSLAQRWRERCDHALLVIDQAEELFTLNGPEVQRRFAELLGRLVLDADIHVLLSLRDDFLVQCQSFEHLRPIFSDITPLTPPVGEALRRALVQPALLSGYRFEDARLVDDILRDVAQERGALPLLAFAMTRLWERRDRDRGVLTRQAYEEIGGVAGALAQHAEITLESMGAVRIPIVREVLRNLVTASGTRTPREREELLSLFADQRDEAEEVLRRLVEARLLTSFEPSSEEESTGRGRLEIVHESLLVTWPRLARWRDQDAEGARVRDQLRQAARFWDERGRPVDLLWTGPTFTDYLSWRKRYTGRLTPLEDSFCRAMETEAGRRRRRARLGIGAAFAAVVTALVIVSQLWIRSRTSEEQAIRQARRAVAQRLLALGQLEEDANPTLAFAYALAALERDDSAEPRRLALRQLWKGPLYFVRSEGSNDGPSSISFSTDGEWLVDSGRTVQLWRRDGSGPFDVGHSFSGNVAAHLTVDSRKLVIVGTSASGGMGADVIRLPELTELGRLETPGEMPLGVHGDQLISVMPRSAGGTGAHVVTRSLTDGVQQTIGFIPGRPQQLATGGSGERYLIVHPGARQVLASTLNTGAGGWIPVLRTAAPVSSFWLDDDLKRIAVFDEARVLHVASLASGREPRQMTADWSRRDARVNGVTFDRTGRWLAAAFDQGLRLWDVSRAPDAAPYSLGRGRITARLGVAFDPSGRWLAAEDLGGLTFWPITQLWPTVLRVAKDQPRDVAFDPAGNWIAAANRFGGVEIWPLAEGQRHRQFAQDIHVSTLAVSPDGKLLATGTLGKVLLVSVSSSRSRELDGFDSFVWAIAFDHTGRHIAAAGRLKGGRHEIVRIFDLESGQTKDLDPGDGADIASVSFLPDGNVLTSSFGGLYRLHLQSGSSERLGAPPGIAFLGPGGRHVLILETSNPNFPMGRASVYDLETGRGWPLTSHGDQVTLMAWELSGKRIVTGSRDGIVRVGPVTGEEPHLLIGHDGPVWGVRVDPSGRFVASASEDGTVRIWPMPVGRPLHTWPREALLDKLLSLTNVRIVPDSTAANGYRSTFVPFNGWDRDPPIW
jgi:WD40 repeat protein